MAKKQKKIRTFKVHEDGNRIPFIRFGGKYLTRELGLSFGDRLELTPLNDGSLVLRKLSLEEATEYETGRQAKALLKKLFTPKQQSQALMVAENRAIYSVAEEIYKHPEKYLQA